MPLLTTLRRLLAPAPAAACRPRPRPTRLGLEPLEGRRVPANLRITQALLVDGNGNEIDAPVVGEMVLVRALWTTTGLTAADRYVVRFWVDGVELDSATLPGQPGAGLPYFWTRAGWFASPGEHAVRVTVDGAGAVAEDDEDDNTAEFGFAPAAPASLPARFAHPLAGVQSRDWTVGNYVDVDPRPGVVRDYRGGAYAYDGHAGWDLGPPNFARMDAGVAVYAAAAGTVTQVQDGNFDRHTTFTGSPPNFVRVAHGNGWETVYLHLAAGTAAVRPGDAVAAGQLLGLAGSSGYSTGVHLHFEVVHNGAPVEPNFAPESYWLDPPPYQGDTAPGVMDYGVTNYNLTFAEVQERPSDIGAFPAAAGATVRFWYSVSHLNPGDAVQVRWYRPGGGLEVAYDSSPTAAVRGGLYFWTLSRNWALPQYQGDWQVALVVNDAELARADFRVGGPAVAEVRVSQGATYVLDGRTTPIDFGSVALGSTPPQRTFTVLNHGYAPLALGNLVLPPGFSLVGGFPTVVAAGASVSFTVRLDTARAGAKFGEVRFDTDDADEGVFNFNVRGVVTGAAPAGAPVLGLPGPALASHNGAAPRVLDGTAALADADSADLAGGSLAVEFAAGGTAADRLGVRHQGTGAGEIGVAGGEVTYEGVVIGAVAGGEGTDPLVVTFTAGATVPAVQALLRSITFANASPAPTGGFRYVRFTVTDDTGLVSNQPIRVVAVGPNRAPALAPVDDRTVPAGQLVVEVPLSGADPDGDVITYTATAQSLAYVLDQQLGLFGDGDYYEDAAGLGERWVRGSGDLWYYILPGGELYLADGPPGTGTGALVGVPGAGYHTDPSLLHDAQPDQPRATLTVVGSALTIDREDGFSSSLVVTVLATDGSFWDQKTFTVTVAG